MWDTLFRRWIDLLFWWLPHKERTPTREPERAPSQVARAPRAAAPSARSEPAARRPAQAEGSPHGAPEPSARPAPKPAEAQPEKPVAPPVPDDLTEIKGIGPALQNKLRALGITTFAELAAANPDELMARLKGSQPLSRGRVRHWTEAARERART